jgi:hypothetical protein
LANTLAAQAGSNTFFVNYAPGVQVDLSVTPTSYINLPVSGYFNAEAFGETIVNQTFPIGTLTAYTANYDTWDDNMNFNGKYYSLELTQSDQCVGYDQSIPACAHFTVDGSGPFLGAQLNFPGGGSSGSLTGGSGNGSWDDTFANSPLLPNFCDTSTNECYASNDPNAPIGNLTVTSNDNPVGAPEPSTAPFLVAGFLTLALFTKKLNV